MKILYYSHFFKPETGAASVRADYFVKSLRNAGHEVFIISPKPSYPLGKIFDGFKGKLIVKNETENIIYLPIWFVGSHSLIGRLLSYISYFKSSLIYLLFNRFKPDVVISSSPPIFTSLAALIYSKIKRAKFIFDIRDVWPDIGIELGILTNEFYIKGLSKIEKYLLKNSHKIIVTANGDKQNVLSKIDNSEKCEIIFNGADTEIFHPIDGIERAEIRKKYNIPTNKKVIIYFGSYNYGMNDIELIPEILLNINPQNDIFFLSIGSGDNLENVLTKIQGKIPFLSFPNLSSKEIAKLVACSDLSIIPRKEIKKDTGGNIPVKCFESWACGIPVILSTIENTDLAKIFDSINFGKRVLPNNAKIFSKTCEEVLNSQIGFQNEEARKFVVNNFDRRKNSEKLLSLLND